MSVFSPSLASLEEIGASRSCELPSGATVEVKLGPSVRHGDITRQMYVLHYDGRPTEQDLCAARCFLEEIVWKQAGDGAATLARFGDLRVSYTSEAVAEINTEELIVGESPNLPADWRPSQSGSALLAALMLGLVAWVLIAVGVYVVVMRRVS